MRAQALPGGCVSKTIDLYQWWVTDPASGRRYKTRHRMTEADALATDPAAERVPGSLETRLAPDGADEHEHTGAQRPTPPA